MNALMARQGALAKRPAPPGAPFPSSAREKEKGKGRRPAPENSSVPAAKRWLFDIVKREGAWPTKPAQKRKQARVPAWSSDAHGSVANRSRPVGLSVRASKVRILDRAGDLQRHHDAVLRHRRRHDARALRQQRGDLRRRHASLGLENAIADDAEHGGDRHHGGHAGDQHQPSDLRDHARGRGVEGLLVVGERTAHDLMAAIKGRSETVVVAAAEAGERLDRVLAARVAELSRSRHKALILAGRVAIDGATIRDPGHRVNAGGTIMLEVPPPDDAAIAAEDIPLDGGVRGRRAHRHRQAGRAGGASRRRQLDRHAGQCAGRPLRRQPLRGRRRASGPASCIASTRTPPASWWSPRPIAPTARSAASSPTTAAAGRCAAAIWRSSGGARPAARHHRQADRPPPARPRQDGGARRRPRGDHPLGGAGALSRNRWRAGREPAGLPAGDRPHPPDPGPSRLDRPSAARRRRLRPRLQDQSQPAGAGSPRSPSKPLADRRSMPISWRSNIQSQGKNLEFRSELPDDLSRLRHGLGAQGTAG